MAASMLGCRKPLVGTGLAISLVLYMYELRNLASDHVGIYREPEVTSSLTL